MSSSIANRSGVLDLTGCNNLNFFLDWSNNVTYKLPSLVTSYQGLGGQSDDLSLCNKLTSFKMYDTNQQTVSNILKGMNKQAKLQKITLMKTGPTDLTWLSSIDTSNLTNIEIRGNNSSYQPSSIKNLDGLENATNLKTLEINGSKNFTDTSALSSCSSLTSLTISDCPNLERLTGLEGCPNLTTLSATTSKIGVISGLDSLTNLTTLNLNNNKVSSISAIANLKNLTSLTLNNNNISDLSPLESLIEDGKIKFTSLNLSNNLLQTTTVSGHSNVDTLVKLYDAGLRTLNISGNNFTPGSTDSLKSLGWTSYTE